MSTVTVTLTLKTQSFPNGTNPGVMRFRLMQGATVLSTKNVSAPFTSATFSGVDDGDYTVTAQRLNSTLGALGDPLVRELHRGRNPGARGRAGHDEHRGGAVTGVEVLVPASIAVKVTPK